MRTDVLDQPQRILVTGVGGAPGFDLVRSLKRLGCDVIGTDANPLASGLLLPGITPRTMAPAGHRDYGPELLELCRELKPTAMLSTVEHELPQLIAMRSSLKDLGVRTWLPAMPAAEACVDKGMFHRVLSEHRVPTPLTFLPHEIEAIPDGCPLVVKPRRGQGATDVLFCSTQQQARVLCELVSDPIIQERVTGDEFTADCLVDRSGRVSAILRQRLVVKGGLSMVSRTFHDRAVTALVTQTLAAVKMVGACCVQGFVSDDGKRITVTEVNGRFAGGFPLAEVAGADLVGQTVRGLFEFPIDHDKLSYQPGISLTKYIETLTIGEPPTGERTGR